MGSSSVYPHDHGRLPPTIGPTPKPKAQRVFVHQWWRPIETAPVPPREALRFDYWPCLLQDKKGNVVGGFGVYRRKPGAKETWRLQWFAGLHDNPGRAKVFPAVKWMPMPPPDMGGA